MRVNLVGLRQPETRFVVFILRSVETKFEIELGATPDAAGAKHDACIAPPAAGKGGAFWLSPTNPFRHGIHIYGRDRMNR